MLPFLSETFKKSHRTGQHLVNGVLANHAVGPKIPVGSIEYHPVCQKSSQHSTSFGKKVQPGIVVGDVVYAEVWKGDTVVADIEELQHLDARRHNANVVFLLKKW